MGFSLIGFILIILWLLLKPKQGLSPLLIESTNNIDSIQVWRDDTTVTLTAAGEIKEIHAQLKRAQKIRRPKAVNINTGYIDLYVFLKTKRRHTLVRILYNVYGGILIDCGGLFYKNDALDSTIQFLFKKNLFIVNRS